MRNIRRISKKYGLRQIVTFFLVCCMFCNPAVLAKVVLTGQELGSGITVTDLTSTTQSMTAGNGGIGYFSDFDIALGHTVTCVQGDPSYNALFKVNSADGTQIYGIFSSDGNIYLQDLRGILIGSEGQINTHEFVASTLNIDNEEWQEFLSGNITELPFTRNSEVFGDVVNQGTITALTNVYLVGSNVINSNTITAPGLVVMAAGDKVYLKQDSSNVVVDVDVEMNFSPNHEVYNNGTIEAPDGDKAKVILAAGDIFSAALDVDSLAAKAFRNITLDGDITTVGDTSLIADTDLQYGGDVTTNGAITAGGNVDIAGNHIQLNEDVSANDGDLTITGRTSQGMIFGEFTESPGSGSEGYWGHIDVADTENPEGRTLYASHDVILKDAYGSGGDEEPPAGEMDLIGHGSLTIEAAVGSIQTQGPFGEGVKITVENASPASLTMKQADPLNLVDYSFGNQNNTHLTLESYNGSIAAVDSHQLFTLGVMGKDENAADQWASIGAGAATAGTTGYGNITLQGHDLERDITATELTSNATDPYTGNIIVTSDNRKVKATGEIIANNGSVTLSAINPENGGIELHANVTSSDFQDYIGDVELKNDVTAESTGGSDITFTGTVDGTYGLTVNTAGVTKFQGKVGSTDPLASLITDAPGRTEIGGGFIYLDGASAKFGDPVLLTSNLSIYEYGDGNIEFASTVDSQEGSNHTLMVNTGSGATIFGGAVGNDALGELSDDEGLGAVTTDADGTTQINGGIVTTTGDQTYHDPVILGDDTTLNGTDVMFSWTLNSDSGNKRSLLVNASGVTTFNGVVGGDDRLSRLETDAAGRTEIGAGTINLDGASAKFGDPVLLTDSLAINEYGAGDIEFADTVDSEEGHNYGLWVYNSGATIFNGAVGSDALGSLSQDTGLYFVWTDDAGTTQINGGEVTTTNDQTYRDPVTLGADTTLNGKNVNFVNTLDSDSGNKRSLLVNASGWTTFKDVVGGIDSLSSLETDDAVGYDDRTEISANVTTTGTQTYNDDVDLNGDVIAESTGDSAITFAKTLNGAHNLTVNTGGITKFQGEVGGDTALASLTTDADGSTQINGGLVTTTAYQTYNDSVTLGDDTTLNATDVTFADTLDSDDVATARSLLVNASGVTTFNGVVGGNNKLSRLETDAGGHTEIGAVTINLQGASAKFGDPVLLTDNLRIFEYGAGNIEFASTVDSEEGDNHWLMVYSDGATIFGDAVGGDALVDLSDNEGLGAVWTDAPGSTQINGGEVTTTNYQTYNDPVTLGDNTTLNGTNVKFANTLDSDSGNNWSLLVNDSGITKFLDEVGGDIALASLTTDEDGSTEISTNVKTTGTQTYNDDVDLMGDVIAESTGDSAITFAKTVDGGHNLTVNTGGNTRFGGNVGSDTPLITLATDAGGTTYVSGDVTTTSGIHFGDNVIADGTSSPLDQTLDAGTGTLDVDGNIEKNTAGNLNLTGDAGIELGGNVTGTGGFRDIDTITFENDVTANGGDQKFDAGPGTLDADGHITKTSSGSLTLAGDSGILLGGNVSTKTPDGTFSMNHLIFEDAVTADGTGDNLNQTFTAAPLASQAGSSLNADSTITKIDGGDPDIDHDGGNLTLQGGWQVNLEGDVVVEDGTLTIEADQDIYLGSSVTSKGDMILTADADGDAIDWVGTQWADLAGGDVFAHGTLESTDGSITISGFDEPTNLDHAAINLYEDALAAYDVTLHNNTKLAGEGDQGIAAGIVGDGTLTAEGWVWKTTPGNLYLYGYNSNPEQRDGKAIDLQYAGCLPAASTSLGNLELLAENGDIQISGDLTTFGLYEFGDRIESVDNGNGSCLDGWYDRPTGGVSIIAEHGKIYTDADSPDPEAGDYMLNIGIVGNSDDVSHRMVYENGPEFVEISMGPLGVDLPWLDEGEEGTAAIVVLSRDDLIFGPDTMLIAKGNYDSEVVDDRPGVDFLDARETIGGFPRDEGDPIDVAVYVGSMGTEDGQGNVHLDGRAIDVADSGTMVVDAYDTVTFGDFETFNFDNFDLSGDDFESCLDFGCLMIKLILRFGSRIMDEFTCDDLEAAAIEYFGDLDAAEEFLAALMNDPEANKGILSEFLTDFFGEGYFFNIDRLEVASRISEWLFQAAGPPARLPFAGDPDCDGGIEDFISGDYILRGAGRDNPLITDGGAWVLEDPILSPPLYEEAGEAAEDQDIAEGGCPPLMNWLANEIGVAEEDIQVALAGTLALNTDIQPCEMCARLMEASKRLEDTEGTRIAAMARVVNEFVTTPAPPSPEQMTQIAAALAEHVGDGTYYAAAGKWIDALVAYVGIMNAEMGYSASDAAAFAQKYLTPVTDSGNVTLNAYVQARLAALGG